MCFFFLKFASFYTSQHIPKDDSGSKTFSHFSTKFCGMYIFPPFNFWLSEIISYFYIVFDAKFIQSDSLNFPFLQGTILKDKKRKVSKSINLFQIEDKKHGKALNFLPILFCILFHLLSFNLAVHQLYLRNISQVLNEFVKLNPALVVHRIPQFSIFHSEKKTSKQFEIISY